MPLRKIVLLNDPARRDVLRKRAQRVSVFDAALRALADDMVETLEDAPGVGLAAPQIGVSQRVIVVRLPDDQESREEYGDDAGVLHVLVNPEVVKASKERVDGVEGCLSIPGYAGHVDRHEQVTVRAQDLAGKEVRVKASGWLARVFQHEIDHLNGQLFIDIATDVWELGTDDDEADGAPPSSPSAVDADAGVAALQALADETQAQADALLRALHDDDPTAADAAPPQASH